MSWVEKLQCNFRTDVPDRNRVELRAEAGWVSVPDWVLVCREVSVYLPLCTSSHVCECAYVCMSVCVLNTVREKCLCQEVALFCV